MTAENEQLNNGENSEKNLPDNLPDSYPTPIFNIEPNQRYDVMVTGISDSFVTFYQVEDIEGTETEVTYITDNQTIIDKIITIKEKGYDFVNEPLPVTIVTFGSSKEDMTMKLYSIQKLPNAQ